MSAAPIVLGDHADIKRSDAAQAANNLVALYREQQSERARTKRDLMPHLGCVADNVGSQSVVPQERDLAQITLRRPSDLMLLMRCNDSPLGDDRVDIQSLPFLECFRIQT